jgi:hypothetical protein
LANKPELLLLDEPTGVLACVCSGVFVLPSIWMCVYIKEKEKYVKSLLFGSFWLEFIFFCMLLCTGDLDTVNSDNVMRILCELNADENVTMVRFHIA